MDNDTPGSIKYQFIKLQEEDVPGAKLKYENIREHRQNFGGIYNAQESMHIKKN